MFVIATDLKIVNVSITTNEFVFFLFILNSDTRLPIKDETSETSLSELSSFIYSWFSATAKLGLVIKGEPKKTHITNSSLIV